MKSQAGVASGEIRKSRNVSERKPKQWIGVLRNGPDGLI